MNELSLFRLNLLRVPYLFTAIGFGIFLLPNILFHTKPWEFWESCVQCMLLTFWLLIVIGIRYPLQLLPILLWELIWKAFWLLLVALPAWRAGTMDETIMGNTFNCAFAVIILVTLPWGYVVKHYLTKAGDPWTRRGAQDRAGAARAQVSPQ
jgi:hypothetical protein